MKLLDKIKSVFGISYSADNVHSPRFETQQLARRETHRKKTELHSDHDIFSALSEVAAPEPVQQHMPEELTHHPSLEQRLSDISRSRQNSEDGIYEDLSELATPEPIERLSANEMARRPSLEESLSRLSH